MRRLAARYNPGQLRDPGGENGGQWTSAPDGGGRFDMSGLTDVTQIDGTFGELAMGADAVGDVRLAFEEGGEVRETDLELAELGELRGLLRRLAETRDDLAGDDDIEPDGIYDDDNWGPDGGNRVELLGNGIVVVTFGADDDDPWRLHLDPPFEPDPDDPDDEGGDDVQALIEAIDDIEAAAGRRDDIPGESMSDAVTAAFQPEHAPAGSPAGGQFTTPGGGGGSTKPAAKPRTRKPAKPGARGRKVPDGQLGFDGERGTGYGEPDARVKDLQSELNRLGLTDAGGKKLRVDGEFGPLTTAAVKKAQQQLGMDPTGTVSPAFIDRLKTMPAPKRTRKAPVKAGRVEAGELLGIELVRPGTWQLQSGEQTFTADMIRDAARHAQRPGARPAPLKLGHNDQRFVGDGEPALGWLGNLRIEEDDDGPVLLGDVTGMPDWLAAAAPTAWPDRSVEGWTDLEVDGEKYSFVIDGLALLGVTPPGISAIRSLRDLPQALGIAASARIVARAPSTRAEATQTPAPEAEAPPITKEAGQMDPAKIREALGLPTEASDDEVKSTLVAAGLVPAAPEPVAASIKDAPGTMRVDASAWQEREERIKRLEANAARQRESERDQVITEAIKAGKFTPARREHWVRAWNADSEGARQLIASLTPGLVPVEAMGYNDADDKDFDAEFGHLFPPSAREASRG
jgi:hypothetical protein